MDSCCSKLFRGMELLRETDSMLDYQFCCTLNQVHNSCDKKKQLKGEDMEQVKS